MSYASVEPASTGHPLSDFCETLKDLFEANRTRLKFDGATIKAVERGAPTRAVYPSIWIAGVADETERRTALTALRRLTAEVRLQAAEHFSRTRREAIESFAGEAADFLVEARGVFENRSPRFCDYLEVGPVEIRAEGSRPGASDAAEAVLTVRAFKEILVPAAGT